jgi:hypothetical protein
MARPDDTATAASQISIAGGLPHFGSVIARTNIDLAIEPGTIQRKRRLS